MTSWERVKARWPQIVLCVLPIILFVAGYQLWYQEQLRVHYRDGFCPRGTWAQLREGYEIPGHTVILIDTSNRIAAADADEAFSRVEAWVRNTVGERFLQRLSVYGLPESTAEIPTRDGRAMCIPMTGDRANPLYRNPVVVEQEFGRFLNELKRSLDTLRTREEQPQSPILETMAVLAERYEELDSFIVISDMLQHTNVADHYEPDSPMTPTAEAICDQLSGVESVWVYYIDRRLDVQPNTWPTPWWRDCLGQVAGMELR